MTKDKKAIELLEIARAFRQAVYGAYCATLVGSPAPITEEFNSRMGAPEVGDWVLEISTVYRSRGTDDLDALGILEKVAMEDVIWSDPDFVWDEAVEGKPAPKERVYYLRTLDGRRFRWTNATIIAVPPLKL